MEKPREITFSVLWKRSPPPLFRYPAPHSLERLHRAAFTPVGMLSMPKPVKFISDYWIAGDTFFFLFGFLFVRPDFPLFSLAAPQIDTTASGVVDEEYKDPQPVLMLCGHTHTACPSFRTSVTFNLLLQAAPELNSKKMNKLLFFSFGVWSKSNFYVCKLRWDSQLLFSISSVSLASLAWHIDCLAHACAFQLSWRRWAESKIKLY